jgi:hypothetical protein
VEMAVRRVTRLDRQNDKHLKRHKRRAELAFTSVPIFLFYLKEAHSGALVLPASNVWAFLVFSENCCYFLACCLQRKNQGSTVTGTTGATVGSCNVKKPAPSHSSVFFLLHSLGFIHFVPFRNEEHVEDDCRFPEGAKYGNTPLDPLAFSIWSRVTHRTHLSSTGPFFIITGNEIPTRAKQNNNLKEN